MTPERRRHVEELYHRALDRSGAEREAVLLDADPELRQEVESLLAQQDATQTAAREVTAGTLIGSYRIEALLGAGGMGQVYKAHDTKLNRSVAIKFITEDLADPVARRRFQREAQMASSLNIRIFSPSMTPAKWTAANISSPSTSAEAR